MTQQSTFNTATDEFFPKVQHRSGWNKPPFKIDGLHHSSYLMQLYNLEASLLLEDWLAEDEIVSGLALALQDLQSVVWFPTVICRKEGITSSLWDESSPKNVGKRFLAIPISLTETHWILTVTDRAQHKIYWFNSLPSCSDMAVSLPFKTWMESHDLIEPDENYIHTRVQVTQQQNSWASGLYVLENARVFFREPSVHHQNGPKDWVLSRHYRWPVPVLGPLDAADKQCAWMKIAWIAWIRAELGHNDFSPLRVPELPTLRRNAEWMAAYRGYGDIIVPNGVSSVNTFDPDQLRADIDYWMGETPNDKTAVPGPSLKLTPASISIVFDTWVSGEAGLMFSDWLDESVQSYAYTRYHYALEEPPAKYSIPMPIEREEEPEEYNDDEEVGDDEGGNDENIQAELDLGGSDWSFGVDTHAGITDAETEREIVRIKNEEVSAAAFIQEIPTLTAKNKAFPSKALTTQTKTAEGKATVFAMRAKKRRNPEADRTPSPQLRPTFCHDASPVGALSPDHSPGWTGWKAQVESHIIKHLPDGGE
ncbi:hypothetical protein CMQ_36 [Grosmannia clavigera kw1407]|uniref:Ubiquitin-like protease family profile domain-containing protein n=1 Tax=Grosmannia clavigera (strain kw1407 / UAMH 11150) TaxID=655863 RepID=F0XR34_GROCL|nr:uncharacterized protein CMQ_36 [Grosmannia clavigera kw1407]EFW99718.1 hypothetical protein CMQ_36 [Grosmannia clavigera kw1407]